MSGDCCSGGLAGSDPVAAATRAWRALLGPPRGGIETVPLDEAVGRCTAEPVAARWSVPAHPVAAMDGIAVRARDTSGAAPDRPIVLAPQAVEVVDTGDPMPAGYDAVVMREHVRRGPDGQVLVEAAVVAGRHVRPVGEDVTAGEPLLPAGHRLRPVDVAVAAGAGHTRLTVRRPPRVAVIPTGDEVRPIGTEGLRPGEVLDTNSLMLAATAREAGATAVVLPVVPDDPEQLRTAVLGIAEQADLVVVIAGSSRGRDDHTASVLAAAGEVAVHGVAIRPGHPVVLGCVHTPSGPVPAIGVPGYPVSAAHVFGVFALPLLARLQGADVPAPAVVTARLGTDVGSRVDLEETVAVRLQGRAVPTAFPTGRGAGALSALMRADGVLHLPVGVAGAAAGSTVEIELRSGAPGSATRGAADEGRVAAAARAR